MGSVVSRFIFNLFQEVDDLQLAVFALFIAAISVCNGLPMTHMSF